MSLGIGFAVLFPCAALGASFVNGMLIQPIRIITEAVKLMGFRRKGIGKLADATVCRFLILRVGYALPYNMLRAVVLTLFDLLTALGAAEHIDMCGGIPIQFIGIVCHFMRDKVIIEFPAKRTLKITPMRFRIVNIPNAD